MTITQYQAENRAERVAIMTVEGMSEEAAHQYCDTKPDQYGTREAKQ